MKKKKPKLITVYRVEDEDGQGPFQSPKAGEKWRYCSRTRHDAGFGPAPFQEGLTIRDYHVCVCRTKGQLRKWFRNHQLRTLGAQGFFVSTYQVPDVRVRWGSEGWQGIAVRSAMYLVDKVSTLEYVRS